MEDKDEATRHDWMYADLDAEHELAQQLELPWKERGPVPNATAATWRGMKYSGGQQMWKKRGGKKKNEWEAHFYTFHNRGILWKKGASGKWEKLDPLP